jgi:murein DD-endopeptidase MepM/ murein hydrolase activator NlpD
MGVVSRRARFALALGPTLAGLIMGGVWSARADTPPSQGASVAQQSPPTTAGLLDQLLQALFPTTSTTPPPQAASGTPSSGGVEPAAAVTAELPPPTAPVPEPGDRTIPPEAQAIINSVLRTGDNNNLGLLEALRRLTDQGMTFEEAALVGMGQFPVAGEAYWSDDWYEPRFTPAFHLHQGTDIFAARGTPVRSPVDGYFSDNSGGAGGLAAQVTGRDGTYYYMAHLDRFADVPSGAAVTQGQVVGFVGTTGNAEGGSPHLHFEVHPGGGGATNPKPIIDRWVSDAIAHLPDLLVEYRVGSLPRPLTAAGLLRRLDAGSLGAPVASDGPQLWTASLRRLNGSLRLTEVASVDGDPAPFDPMMKGARAKAVDWLRAEQLARDVLAPLTPKVMESLAQRGGG